jgi:acetolactate synthase-1/2/3 large subunit
VLTQVIISYEGREMRWLSALRSQYIKKLPNDQKLRLATRIGVRTISRQADSD